MAEQLSLFRIFINPAGPLRSPVTPLLCTSPCSPSATTSELHPVQSPHLVTFPVVSSLLPTAPTFLFLLSSRPCQHRPCPSCSRSVRRYLPQGSLLAVSSISVRTARPRLPVSATYGLFRQLSAIAACPHVRRRLWCPRRAAPCRVCPLGLGQHSGNTETTLSSAKCGGNCGACR